MPDNRAHSLLIFEQKKAEFFAEQCGGIQFEFDRWTNTVRFKDWNAGRSTRKPRPLDGMETMLLPLSSKIVCSACKAESNNAGKTGSENDCADPRERGNICRQRLTAKLPTNQVQNYAGVLGHWKIFRMSLHGAEKKRCACIEDNIAHLLGDLSRVFEVVRLVDPKTNDRRS